MIEIKGIKTEQEAMKLYEEETTRMRAENKCIAVHNVFTVLKIVLLCGIIGSVTAYRVTNGFTDWENTPGLLVVFTTIIIVIVWCVMAWESKYMFLPNEYSKACQYYLATKGKTLIDAETKYIGYDCTHVCLTVSDAEDTISYVWIKGFSQARKNNIKNTIVDLDSETIYLPYINQGTLVSN